jgi:hypothetical protein
MTRIPERWSADDHLMAPDPDVPSILGDLPLDTAGTVMAKPDLCDASAAAAFACYINDLAALRHVHGLRL